MVTSVASLLTEKTVDGLVEEGLDVLAGEDLPATAWQEGSVPRSLLKADATALKELYDRQRALAAGNYLSGEGDWLTLYADSRYDEDRVEALATEGQVSVTVASGAGPHTITAGGLLVTDGVRRFRSTNTSSVTVTSAAATTFTVRAESAGAAYNATAVNTLTTIVSPALAGLSVNNPAISPTSTWITRTGADAESDASLRGRCRAKWGTLGRGANNDAYIYWATSAPAAPAVKRALTIPNPGDGTVTVYIATESGAASGAEVTSVQAYLDTQGPITDTAVVVAAAAVTITITGTVFVRATSDSAANRALATAALAAYQKELGIGDDVDLGRIYAAIYAAAGVTDVDLSSPSGDTSIGATQVAVFSVSLTWTTA
jgi:phage-related baseplate assembly protein